MKQLTSSQLKKNIGEKIKFYRKKLKISQFELAEKVNMEMKSLSRIESGYNYPQCENLVAIAQVLEVSPWQLYFIDEYKSPEEMKKEIISTLENNENSIPVLYQYLKMQ